MKFRFNGQKGFSIVELLIVVGIIGVLASVGLPKMQVFLAKSKRAEVKTVLGSLNTFEQAYYADNSKYGTDLDIGFSKVLGTPNMKFNTAIWTFDLLPAAPDTGFTGRMVAAAGALCKGAISESWTITAITPTTGFNGAAAATAGGTDWKTPTCT